MTANVSTISIIIPVLNGAATLQCCISSVACQTYPHKEVILIDGGSTDHTLDIIQANDQCIDYWVSEPDGSIYQAFNKGLSRAKGDWIIFLGADDYLWNAHVLSKIACHFAEAYPRYAMIYGRVAVVDLDGKLTRIRGNPWSDISSSLSTLNISHQGILHHRTLFERHGEFDETFQITGDYELLLRHLKSSKPLYIPDVIIAAWRLGGISSNPRNHLRCYFERRRAQEKNGLTPNWMSRVERMFYRIYMMVFELIGERMTKIFFILASFFISIDRRLRHY